MNSATLWVFLTAVSVSVVSASAQTPSDWSFETVAIVPPEANSCIQRVPITGLGFDAANHPIVGWNGLNACGGNSLTAWARLDGQQGWTTTDFFIPYASGNRHADFAHRLLTRDDGVPFMLYAAIEQTWFSSYYLWEADLSKEPTGPGEVIDFLGYPGCGVASTRVRAAFAPNAARPNVVRTMNCNGGGLWIDGTQIDSRAVEGADIAVGPDGRRHVLYSTGGAAYYSTGAQDLSLGPINRFSQNVAIAVDAAHRIHAAVGGSGATSDGDPGALEYLTSTDGVTWTRTTIGRPAMNALSVALALDAKGQPAVAYLSGNALWLATPTDGKWISQLVRVFTSLDTISEFVLRFDAQNLPVIALYDPAIRKVLIARPAAPAPVDIAVTAQDSPDPAPVGGRVTFAVSATNPSDRNASGIALNVDLDPSLVFSSASPPPTTRSGNHLTFNIGSLSSSGHVRRFVIDAVAHSDGVLASTTSVSATEPDDNLLDNVFNVRTRVRPLACFVPRNGLVALWAGDGDARDAIANHHGTLSGPVTFTPGRVGQAFELNGVNAAVDASDDDVFTPAGSFSLQAWVRSSQTAGYQTIVSKHTCGRSCFGNPYSAYFLGLSDGRASWTVRTGSNVTQSVVGSRPLADGEWHHIVAIRDVEGGLLRLYVDGLIDASAALTATGALYRTNDYDPVVIGAYYESGADAKVQFFNGAIDDVAYYERTLQYSEVLDLLSAQRSAACGVPTIAPVPDQRHLEDEGVSLQMAAHDPDGEPFTFSASGLPPGLTLDPMTGSIAGTLTFEAAGVHHVAVTAMDGDSQTARTAFTWTILNVNRAPLAENAAGTTIEGQAIDVLLTAPDPDGDIVTFSLVTLPAHGSAVVEGGLVTYSPAPGYSGPDGFNVRASDGTDFSNVATVTIDVTPLCPPVGHCLPPAFEDPGKPFNDEGESVELRILASDPDGDPLTFHAAGLPSGITLDASLSLKGIALLTGTLGFDTAGAHDVTVSASDGPHTALLTFRWTIHDVNRPPSITNPGTQFNVVGDVIDLGVVAVDPDGDALTFAATGLPPTLTIREADGVIGGKLSADAGGAHPVMVTATDARGASAVTSFDWIIKGDAVNTCEVVRFEPPIDHQGAERVWDMIPADFNGDGFVDILTNANVWFGDGAGHFQPANIGTSRAWSRAAVGDVNGDGRPDIVTINEADVLNQEDVYRADVRVTIWLNAGNGSFTATAAFSRPWSQATSLALGDFNGDGRMDLALANASALAIDVHNGDGAGGFGVRHAVSIAGEDELPGIGYVLQLTAVDVNRDGRLDLIVSVGGRFLGVMLSEAGAGFAPYRRIGSPVALVTAGDVTGEGQIDLLADDGRVWTGDGSGGFVPGPFWPVQLRRVVDLNRDGVADLVGVVRSRLAVALGLGEGSFATPTLFGAELDGGGAIAVADVNVDGIQDVLLTNDLGFMFAALITRCTPGNSPPIASARMISTAEDAPLDVTLSGADSDGDPLTYTLVTAPAHGTLTGTPPALTYWPARDFFGQDQFSFVAHDQLVTGAPATVTIEVTPVNDAPVAVPDRASTVRLRSVRIEVLSNDTDIDSTSLTIRDVTSPAHGSVSIDKTALVYEPSGKFAGIDTFSYTIEDDGGLRSTAEVVVDVHESDVICSVPFSGELLSTGIAGGSVSLITADFNGDGVMDVLSGGDVWLGDGAGHFQPAGMVTSGAWYRAALGDLNGDGRPDVVGISTQFGLDDYDPTRYVRVSAWINTGSGRFVEAWMVTRQRDEASDLALGDFNGDGLLDVALANSMTTTIDVRSGDGAGAFGASRTLAIVGEHVLPGFGDVLRLTAVDLNRDGRQDVIVSATAHFLGVIAADADGGFSSYRPLSTSTSSSRGVGLHFAGDATNDGLVDLLDDSGQIWVGDGGGGFAPGPWYPLSGEALKDVNGDGVLDLIGFPYSFQNRLTVSLGTHDGSFAAPMVFGARLELPGPFAVADVDGDGKNDVLIVHEVALEPTVGIMFNTCQAGFADLAVSQTADRSPIAEGELVTFTVAVTNHGTGTATDVRLIDTAPSNGVLESMSTTQGTCLSRSGTTCELGTLAPGATATATLVVRALSVGSLINHARTGGGQSDPNASNNVAELTVAVTPACLPNGGCLPPTIADPGKQFNAEGDAVELWLSANDPDGDLLTFDVAGLPLGINIDASLSDKGFALLKGTLGFDTAGTYDVIISVSDGGHATQRTFQWIVSDTNRSPSITNPGNQSNLENDAIQLPINASDPDADPLRFTATGLPAPLVIGASDGVIRGTVFPSSVGTHHVSITVSDGRGASTTTAFDWTVTRRNRPPQIAYPRSIFTEPGQFGSVTVQVTDPDGDPVTLTVSGLPDGLSFDAESRIISGASFALGGHAIRIDASDGQAKSWVTFTWTVQAAPTWDLMIDLSLDLAPVYAGDRLTRGVFVATLQVENSNDRSFEFHMTLPAGTRYFGAEGAECVNDVSRLTCVGTHDFRDPLLIRTHVGVPAATGPLRAVADWTMTGADAYYSSHDPNPENDRVAKVFTPPVLLATGRKAMVIVVENNEEQSTSVSRARLAAAADKAITGLVVDDLGLPSYVAEIMKFSGNAFIPDMQSRLRAAIHSAVGALAERGSGCYATMLQTIAEDPAFATAHPWQAFLNRYGEAWTADCLREMATPHYDRVEVLTDTSATFANFKSTVERLHNEGYTIDLLLDLHGCGTPATMNNFACGNAPYLLFSDGPATLDGGVSFVQSGSRPTLRSMNSFDNGLRTVGGYIRLNSVYMVSCWGSNFNQMWLDLGAQESNGPQELNYFIITSPLTFLDEFKRKGTSLERAAQVAYDEEQRVLFDIPALHYHLDLRTLPGCADCVFDIDLARVYRNNLAFFLSAEYGADHHQPVQPAASSRRVHARGVPVSLTDASIYITDPVTGSPFAIVTPEAILSPGTLTAQTSSTGPSLSSGYSAGTPALFTDLSTTAVLSGPTEVCFTYDPARFTNESTLRLLHFEDGRWYDRTSSLDTETNTVCASVTHFSPFVVVEIIDSIPPTITLTAPTTTTYLLNEHVTAAYSCADAGSGVASCAGTVATGAPVPTNRAGAHSFHVTATDYAGNVTRASVPYSVSYRVCLLYDWSKSHKTGSTVPITVQVCDATGANVSSSAIRVTAVRLLNRTTGTGVSADDAGRSNPEGVFRYDVAAKSYVYTLKTKELTAGTWALEFAVDGDPTRHQAQFAIR